MKTTINFDDMTWTCESEGCDFEGSFVYNESMRKIQIDWYDSDLPSNWEDIENDIYLEVIANY